MLINNALSLASQPGSCYPKIEVEFKDSKAYKINISYFYKKGDIHNYHSIMILRHIHAMKLISTKSVTI